MSNQTVMNTINTSPLNGSNSSGCGTIKTTFIDKIMDGTLSHTDIIKFQHHNPKPDWQNIRLGEACNYVTQPELIAELSSEQEHNIGIMELAILHKQINVVLLFIDINIAVTHSMVRLASNLCKNGLREDNGVFASIYYLLLFNVMFNEDDDDNDIVKLIFGDISDVVKYDGWEEELYDTLKRHEKRVYIYRKINIEERIKYVSQYTYYC